MQLSLGISPCPNDTFMFDALLHHKIDTEGIEFNLVLADVEQLNRNALDHQLDISKVSYHSFLHLINHYQLSDSGSALGRGCGPLLIAKRPMNPEEMKDLKVGIPGKYTTANLLFSLAYPHITNKTELVFSDIENAILHETIDAGVIIHENRFTYHEKGLIKIMDLGDYWERKTALPIPLGGIAVKRNLHHKTKMAIQRIIARSIQYGFDHPSSSLDFIKLHAQEMESSVLQKHIDLYVNEYSLSLNVGGKAAVNRLIQEGVNIGILKEPTLPIYLE